LENGFVESKFRESRDENGKLTFISSRNRIKVIQDKEVVDVERNKLIKIKEIIDTIY
jgi:hypothetical protein